MPFTRPCLQVDSSSTNAELEISGSTSTDENGVTLSGKIRICNLVFLDVEAENFEVSNTDTDTLLLDTIDVPAGNVLGVEILPANTDRCGKGGVSVLSLGEEIPSGEEPLQLGEAGLASSIVTTGGRQGLRAARIRILGPPGGTGFIENLIIKRSSVFGKIKLQDLEIQDLILQDLVVETPPI